MDLLDGLPDKRRFGPAAGTAECSSLWVRVPGLFGDGGPSGAGRIGEVFLANAHVQKAERDLARPVMVGTSTFNVSESRRNVNERK